MPLDSFRPAKADNSAVESTFLFGLKQLEHDVATSSGSAARRFSRLLKKSLRLGSKVGRRDFLRLDAACF